MHKRARLGIGYLTQEPSVFRKLSAEENILAILETCKLSLEERAVRLKYLLDELDLTPIAKSKAYQLSGGEKRRLEITRALVTSPKLLLLDEPFSGIVRNCCCWTNRSVALTRLRFTRCRKLSGG
jgi:lipopolysaccharide export system ATP-binding protein